MKCKTCGKPAVSERGLCKDHFIEYFENLVFDCIKKYDLTKKGENIMVATSGGKDSLTVLYLVKKITGKATALIINEGILDYREHTLDDLKNFCTKHDVELKIVTFKDEFGKTLDEIITENRAKGLDVNPCSVCGVLRRFLLNKYSQGYDKIVLGHNLDDEVQAVMMNFLRGNLEISARLGPKTGLMSSDKFTQRIKPLYFCPEKEVKIYSFLKGFVDVFTECPYSGESYRSFVRTFLNKEESKNPGIKENIINNFLRSLPKIKDNFRTSEEIKKCENCGYPARHKLCNTCLTLEKYGLLKK